MESVLIYTCLAEGQALKKEVLEGIAKNGCDLIVTTNSGRISEDGKTQNLRKLTERFEGEYFIFIDSDVVLAEKDAINKMLVSLAYNPIVTIPTKPCHIKANFPDVMPHAVCGIKKNFMQIFKSYLYSGGCVYCNFLKVHNPTVLWDVQSYEIPRR